MAWEEELEIFIEEVHNEPYNLFENNCVHKHARIIDKARELGHDASMITCVAFVPRLPLTGLPLIGPHFYAQVDGETVDVSFEPCLEQVACRNEEIARLFPINLTKLRPYDPFTGPPLPSGYFPPWPWGG